MFGVIANVACGSGTVHPGVVPDGGTDTQPDVMTRVDGGGESNQLRAIASPPPIEDPRLNGFLNENPGNNPDGWDFCKAGPFRRGPGDCATCPPPPAGTYFFRYTGGLAVPSGGPATIDCQAYGYFTTPLPPNQTRGLWFDLLRIDGDPSDATLTVYATTHSADTVETLGTWPLSEILSEPLVWKRTCANISPKLATDAIGFRFAGVLLDAGLAAPHFGPVCPGM